MDYFYVNNPPYDRLSILVPRWHVLVLSPNQLNPTQLLYSYFFWENRINILQTNRAGKVKRSWQNLENCFLNLPFANIKPRRKTRENAPQSSRWVGGLTNKLERHFWRERRKIKFPSSQRIFSERYSDFFLKCNFTTVFFQVWFKKLLKNIIYLKNIYILIIELWIFLYNFFKVWWP